MILSNKMQWFVALMLFISVTSQNSLAGGKTHWGYTGHEGPAHWGGLSSDYHVCRSGREQSPVNINGSSMGRSRSILFGYSSKPSNIVNNGHTIQVNMKEGSRITVNDKTYELLQFHFHSPSEHQVDGQHAAMVIHFVHKADDGQLGVVGLLLDKGKSNKIIEQLWQYMPEDKGGEAPLPATVEVKRMLPLNRAFYNYSGSLTTPPCSEGVNWMVLKGRGSVSHKQVKKFTTIFPNSIRPIQPINHRTIYSR